MSNPLLKYIDAIPEGYSLGSYRNSTYGITKTSFNSGKSIKIYGDELGRNDFVGLNYYITTKKNLLKPCEMSEAKVVDFLKNVLLK